jgi:hypothetical protein
VPDFESLKNKAKDLIDKRGGVDALKADAEELKNIATGEGTLKEKASAAVEAIKDPGKAGADAPADPDATPATAASTPSTPTSPAAPESPTAPPASPPPSAS